MISPAGRRHQDRRSGAGAGCAWQWCKACPHALRLSAAAAESEPGVNFKSDGRHFADSKRCLIILSGFFEFTGTKYPKAKHRFSLKGSPLMAIAGLWREPEKDGDRPSFTMLTTTPGPDIEPYHDRQVVVLKPEDWAHWLFLTKPETELLRPLPEGSLEVVTVRPGA